MFFVLEKIYNRAHKSRSNFEKYTYLIIPSTEKANKEALAGRGGYLTGGNWVFFEFWILNFPGDGQGPAWYLNQYWLLIWIIQNYFFPVWSRALPSVDIMQQFILISGSGGGVQGPTRSRIPLFWLVVFATSLLIAFPTFFEYQSEDKIYFSA